MHVDSVQTLITIIRNIQNTLLKEFAWKMVTSLWLNRMTKWNCYGFVT